MAHPINYFFGDKCRCGHPRRVFLTTGRWQQIDKYVFHVEYKRKEQG